MSDTSENKLKELLDRLQVESWQLELLVSGFAIFLTANSFEPIADYSSRLAIVSEGINAQFKILQIFSVILSGSMFFIFINLILHVVFRGLWISAIGLRSISGEIDFKELKFAAPFDKFMKNRIGSFDNFIQRLEDISSVIFAFTFLIIFMIISLFLFIIFMGIVGQVVNPIMGNDPALGVVIIVLSTFAIIVIGSFLYFLDFITIGFFKRKRWIAIWYYPIYRFFSLITFSWLYRPLYYNLIDNKFGRRVGLFLVPYFIIIIGLATMKASVNLYIPEQREGFEILNNYFENTREKGERIHTISIPSKFINNGYLELFIKYNALNDDRVIKEICPSITPDEISGIKSNLEFSVSGNSEDKYHSPPDSLLMCVSQLYQVYINDSLYQDLDYYFYTNQAFGEEGLKTIIDLGQTQRGKYALNINRMTYNVTNDSMFLMPFATTPFWIE
jgi:hypothetical protein